MLRAGRQEEVTLISNELGVSNHTSTEEEWVRASKNANAIVWKKNPMMKDLVPDVTGMTFRDAIYLLERAGLRVYFGGKGRVAEQSLHPGSRFSKGSRIYLKLS
jgi:cell division protein FtsI (penicillin-binding protein 3)